MGILELGAYASAIGATVAIVAMVAEAYCTFKRMERHQKENYLTCLKLVIMSEKIPLTERIEAGHKYIALGGNGAIRKHYEALIKEYGKETNE